MEWALLGTGPVNTGGVADQPSIALIGGVPWVAYVEKVAGVDLVRVSRWTGSAWEVVGPPLNTNLATSAAMPYLVGIGGVPYVAFREPTGASSRIVVKRFP